ncbi:hypothetical protein PR048_003798 [Dryococelus australis]|uniref:RING-CH-type domain-containing protein n=1 Tax=Dryococelus australis TaxID=614101 RepID=A0ABQ9IP36_9NEOP|nr:hypothetical protein PR048_003798 [Dryococelus australis]
MARSEATGWMWNYSSWTVADAEKECRICSVPEEAGSEVMLAPCDCRGTMRWIHCSCLMRWIQCTCRPDCEICGTEYRCYPTTEAAYNCADLGSEVETASGNEPPSELGSDEPPSELGNGEPPSELGSDEPPSELGSDEPPSELGNDKPPSELGSGEPPSELDSGEPPSELGSGEPPSELGSGEPPSELGSDEPPSELGSGEPPSELGSGEPPSELGSGEPPSELGSGEPPSELGSGEPPSELGSDECLFAVTGRRQWGFWRTQLLNVVAAILVTSPILLLEHDVISWLMPGAVLSRLSSDVLSTMLYVLQSLYLDVAFSRTLDIVITQSAYVLQSLSLDVALSRALDFIVSTSLDIVYVLSLDFGFSYVLNTIRWAWRCINCFVSWGDVVECGKSKILSISSYATYVFIVITHGTANGGVGMMYCAVKDRTIVVSIAAQDAAQSMMAEARPIHDFDPTKRRMAPQDTYCDKSTSFDSDKDTSGERHSNPASPSKATDTLECHMNVMQQGEAVFERVSGQQDSFVSLEIFILEADPPPPQPTSTLARRSRGYKEGKANCLATDDVSGIEYCVLAACRKMAAGKEDGELADGNRNLIPEDGKCRNKKLSVTSAREGERPFRNESTVQQAIKVDVLGPFRNESTVQQAIKVDVLGPFRNESTVQQAIKVDVLGPFRNESTVQQATKVDVLGPFRNESTVQQAIKVDVLGPFRNESTVQQAIKVDVLGPFRNESTVQQAIKVDVLGPFRNESTVQQAIKVDVLGPFRNESTVQ